MSDKLVIFDCDGVLVDSEFVSSKVFAEAISGYGYPMTTEESIRRFTGVTAEACREIIMHESGLDIPKDYWAKQQPLLDQAHQLELHSLLEPLLEVLREHQILRCVASNSSRNHIVQCLELTNQLGYFTDGTIFSSHQVRRAKPAPDLFLFAADKMGVKPENCIVVEDSSIGAKAACAAGMQVLMYVGGSHASFDWYRAELAKYNQPMVSTCHELIESIFLSFQNRQS